jgi:T4 RnlA family RNA ligase
MKNHGMQQFLTFITENKNWEEILRNKPYCLKIRHSELDNNLTIFSYNMIDSDFYNPIVKVCRGLILNTTIPKIICWPMNKFFNYGEPQAAKIDWDSAYRREKIDGSLIKLYWNDKWQFATNNGFNADAEIQNFIVACEEKETDSCKTFQDLIDYSLSKNPINFAILDKNRTYYFELTSPRNRIVVYHPTTSLWLLGARDIITGEEFKPEELKEIDIQYPPMLVIKDFDLLLKNLETMTAEQEGYVVVDKNFNRIKMKGLAYLQVHKMKDNNGQFTYKSLFEAIMNNTQDDIKAYFPETISYITKIENSWKELITKLHTNLEYLNNQWIRISSKPPFDQHKKRYASIVLPDYQWMSSAAFELTKGTSLEEAQKIWLAKIDWDRFKELTGFVE